MSSGSLWNSGFQIGVHRLLGVQATWFESIDRFMRVNFWSLSFPSDSPKFDLPAVGASGKLSFPIFFFSSSHWNQRKTQISLIPNLNVMCPGVQASKVLNKGVNRNVEVGLFSNEQVRNPLATEHLKWLVTSSFPGQVFSSNWRRT